MTCVLVLGGLSQDRTRHLLRALIQDEAVHFVRVVDRFLVLPPQLFTFYCDSETKDAFVQGTKAGKLEYMQANLLVQASRQKAFALPADKASRWDVCYDFTGETDPAATDQVHAERTLRLALLVAHQAREASVGSYVRHIETFYRSTNSKNDSAVGDQGVEAQAWGKTATWYHLAAMALARIQGLNLVLVRSAIMYGPTSVMGVIQRCLLGEIYRFSNDKLEFLWSPDLAQNTIHVDDWARACLAIAKWHVTNKDDHASLSKSFERLVPVELDSAQSKLVKDLEPDLLPKLASPIEVPCFTIVDDAQTTQKDLARVVGESVGVKTDFQSSVINAFAKLSLTDVVEDANEKHLEVWTDLLAASDPPIKSHLPVSPFVTEDVLKPYPIRFSNQTLKSLTGWTPKNRMTTEVVSKSIDTFRQEGLWPRFKQNDPKKRM